jgi:hypothetical protein
MSDISAMKEGTNDWKLRLRYGKLTTAFKRFTVLADGVVGEFGDGFKRRPGRAWMSMKTWATDSDESMERIPHVVSNRERGFCYVDGELYYMEIDLEIVSEEGDTIEDEPDSPKDQVNCVDGHIHFLKISKADKE